MNLFPFDTEKAMYVPTALFMCGPPACGKSTYIKKYASELHVILSRDEIRNHIWGRAYKPSSEKEKRVTDQYNYLVKLFTAQNYPIIIDKTNCDETRFKAEITLFEKAGYKIFVKFFDVSYKTLIFREIKRRLTDRSKPSVPFKVIKDMKRRYDKLDRAFYKKYES
jgi:predicted kinase